MIFFIVQSFARKAKSCLELVLAKYRFLGSCTFQSDQIVVVIPDLYNLHLNQDSLFLCVGFCIK